MSTRRSARNQTENSSAVEESIVNMDFMNEYPRRNTRRSTRIQTQNVMKATAIPEKKRAGGSKSKKKGKRLKKAIPSESYGSKNHKSSYGDSEVDIVDENSQIEDEFLDDDEITPSEENSSGSESDSFSEFIEKKEEEKEKNQQKDLSKMTKRQKQAYLVKNNIIEVTEQSVNKKTGSIGLEDETVLFSLDPSRKSKPLRSEMPRRIKRHKAITDEERAEKQTQDLKTILEDIAIKEKEREDKQKKLKEEKEFNSQRSLLKIKEDIIAYKSIKLPDSVN
jgi:hypothetical protein